MKYASVIVENKSKHTDMFFTYRKGDLELGIGDKVDVPFGTKEISGYVFGFTDDCEVPDEKLKDILRVSEYGSLNEEMIKTASWMRQRYAITYFDAINLFAAKGKPPKAGKEKEPYKELDVSYPKPEELTSEQKNALSKIERAIEDGKQESFLLHGVTSSGKTEVYLETISRCIEKGKTAIMLVPEISLTKQVIDRFSGRFGKSCVAVLHSKLTPRERFDEWVRIRSGQAKIVVGARMGVFAPLDNIGCIILDEEHEASYKADMSPKYDTVEVAQKRLMASSGVLVLGSATPSVVSYERCREGIFTLLELKERYNRTPLPKLEMVDMRKELREGNTSIFSDRLYNAMNTALENKEQVILLQNRRGYANFVSCRECGHVIKCRECGISLTYHKTGNALVCHYCGKKIPNPKECPECGSKYIKQFGIGTEQVEEQAALLYPDKRVERLDIDSIKNRKNLDGILNRFKKGETDILVGTQLVAKGLDFANVGVVGIISADTTLNIPDYRSTERTYQLVTQASGRAGRGDKQGTVIVQSYEPENYVFKAAKDNDYQMFFTEETTVREYLEYPPFGDIIQVNITCDDESISLDIAEQCREYAVNILEIPKKKVLNPKLSANFKGNSSTRYYVIIKCPKGERNKYMHYLDEWSRKVHQKKGNVNINIDVNPYSIF